MPKCDPIEAAKLPTWIYRYVDTDVMSQKSRYTTKHITHNHVALIFRGRKLLAVGQNRPFRRGFEKSIHAEYDAIRSLGDITQLRGATLVVIRISSTGLMGSKPCAACQCLLNKCMREYGLRAVHHT